MRSYLLRLELEWELEAQDEEDALEQLASQIERANETAENIFWEGIEVTEIKGGG
jgi:hypothetical protein